MNFNNPELFSKVTIFIRILKNIIIYLDIIKNLKKYKKNIL